MSKVTAKLAGQRKARDWHVMPTSDGRVIVQAHDSIGILDPHTGQGRLTLKGGYFPHLAFAPPFAFPADFVTAALDACPAMGSVTRVAGGIIHNTVEVF